jgi:copper chaperone
MTVFRVDDMTCGHCAGTITKAVQAVDHGARVEVDLGKRLVNVEPATVDAEVLRETIVAAGYNPVPVELHAAPVARAGGCCCGGASRCGA